MTGGSGGGRGGGGSDNFRNLGKNKQYTNVFFKKSTSCVHFSRKYSALPIFISPVSKKHNENSSFVVSEIETSKCRVYF